MIQRILYDFGNAVFDLKNNKEILDIYREFLDLYDKDGFSDYTFIVGTNDSIGVEGSKTIKNYLDKKILDGNNNIIYTYDILNSYEYFFVLKKDLKDERFGIHFSLFLDTNVAGLFSKFIETKGESTHKIIEKVMNSNFLELNFLFYYYENIKNPDKKCSEKAMNTLENLCKFNSLYRDKFAQNRSLEYNSEYFAKMYDYFKKDLKDKSNSSNKIFAEYNYIYTYLIFAFLEKNNPSFNTQDSFIHMLHIMQEAGTNYSELLEFIYDYFKNGNNKFFRAVKTEKYDKIIEKIKNMSWDIFFYYSIRHSLSSDLKRANFGYPIFATMDEKFTENYSLLFENKILVFKNNRIQYCLRKPKGLTEEMQNVIVARNIEDKFQRAKLIDDNERYHSSLRLKENAERCLKNLLEN